MASLTSQQINDTYKGLIKLADATTGITSSLQSIQDGLGNDLPLKVKEGQIQGQNLFSLGYFVPDYEGPGFSATMTQFPANSQNKLIAVPFYNPGINSFSAITYRIATATTSSDTASIAFYTAQYINGLGLQPKDLVMSGISLNTTPTGNATSALPSTLSFSALGSGVYFMVIKVSNAGVQPTIRYTALPNPNMNLLMASQLGVVLDAGGTAIQSPFKSSVLTSNQMSMVYSTLADFQTSFVAADFSGGIATSGPAGPGFALNVIK